MTKTKVKREAGPSGYARWFDSSNPNFNDHTPSLNEHFLQSHQFWANRRLNARGYIMLNEVYEALGYEPTEAGCVVGWVSNRVRGGNQDGDGYVDFGFGDWPTAEDFAKGRENSVMLDFNVDGEVAKLMKGGKV